VIYLDSSALVKLALTGPESAELADWLAERDGQPLVSSMLHRAEVPRTVWQAEPGALPRSYKVIKRIARVALSPDVLDDSATLPPQDLSPAQAIHLAELSLSRLHFDPTHLIFYGAYESSKPRPQDTVWPPTDSSSILPAHITHGYGADTKLIQVGVRQTRIF